MIATGIFNFLRSETQRSFGEGSYLFFPAERGGSSYTVIVPCTAGTNRGKGRDLSGLLTMAADTRVFDVAAADVPFDPRPEDILLYGTPIADTAKAATAVPATDKITVAAHGYAEGTALRLTATVWPAPLVSGKLYYVRAGTSGDFELAEAPGGAAVPLNTAGSGLTVAKLIADPENPPVKYRLTAADKATFHTHWRLSAERHG